MRILITGAAGFIGSHLCDNLLDGDHYIVGFDNLSLGRMSNIKHLKNQEGFKFIEGDILDATQLDLLFRENDFDVIFHMAANSDIAQSHQNPDIDKDNTFLTTYELLRKMKEFDVNKIVFASTSAIYGDTAELLHEDYGPLTPVSHYGASKLAAESFICSFVENYGLQAWIVRFPNVVGERATHGVIFDFIKKLKKEEARLEVLGDGEQYKPYLYVKDLVEAILYVWQNSDKKINTYNLGVDSRTKVKDIARMVIEEMGLSATIDYTGGDRGWVGDVPQFNYDLSKINSFGWEAKNSSDEAVLKSIQYILSLDTE